MYCMYVTKQKKERKEKENKFRIINISDTQ